MHIKLANSFWLGNHSLTALKKSSVETKFKESDTIENNLKRKRKEDNVDIKSLVIRMKEANEE